MQGKTAGILLAAGRSERFGGDKLLADFGGVPLLSYSARLLSKINLDYKIAVVPAGHEARTELLKSYNIDIVENPDLGSGQGSSTAIGTKAAIELGCERALILLADMPDIPPDHCEELIRLSSDHDWVFTQAGDISCPPAVISRSALNGLTLLSEDRGAKSVAPKGELKTVNLPNHLARDMDTKEDFRAAQ